MKMKHVWLFVGAIFVLLIGVDVFAATSSDLGTVASKVRGNLSNIAKLITAMAYVGGMAFAIGAIVKFKAHKDNPTQVAIGTPIALLFIGFALMFVPSVFSAGGGTLFGTSGLQGTVSGVSSF